MVKADAQSTIRLLFFSSLREVSGVDETEWPWPPSAGASPVVASLLAELYERWPALSSWDGRLLMAVDLEYATRETQLFPGQEVALMPPVQGG